MKFRTDFVTNSSSSSFLISIEKEVPQIIKDNSFSVKNFVFKDYILNVFEKLKKTDDYKFHSSYFSVQEEDLRKENLEDISIALILIGEYYSSSDKEGYSLSELLYVFNLFNKSELNKETLEKTYIVPIHDNNSLLNKELKKSIKEKLIKSISSENF